MATRFTASAALLALSATAALLALLPAATLAVTSPYVRPPPRETLSLRNDDADDGKTPQQVRPRSALCFPSHTTMSVSCSVDFFNVINYHWFTMV
jgi:hypothetical protein